MFQILECSKKKNLKIEHHHQPYKDVLDKCGIQIFIGSHTSFFITILKEGPHYPRIECTTYVTLALGSLSQCPCVIRIDRGGNSSKRSHCGAKISLRSKMSAFSNLSLLLLEKLTGHDFEVVFSARSGIVKAVRGTFIKT